MKKIYIVMMLWICLSIISGCKKFLVEQSQDELRPSTIQDLVALMAGSGYPYQTNLNPFLELMTDDVQCNGGQGQAAYAEVVKKGKGPFTWSKDMYQELLQPGGWASTTYVNSWQIIYGRISACNVVLEHIDKVSGGEPEKNNLRGQALAMRAYYYFILVNMYGKPYNAPGIDPGNSPGVPLKLSMNVTDSLYPRNSVAEVYSQVERDLKSGLKLMQDNPKGNGIYKMSPTAAFAMLSRMYLYQEKWEQSIAFADSAIVRQPGLTQLSTYKARPSGGYYLFNNATTFDYGNRIYDPGLSKEIIWMYKPIGPNTGKTDDEVYRSAVFGAAYSNSMNPPYAVANELLALYETRPMTDTAIYLADLRIRTYFLTTAYSLAPFAVKYYGGSYGVGGAGIRMAEMYLNRAEAKIQLAIKSGDATLAQTALADLNMLRSSRYDARRAYVPVAIANLQQLLSFCRDERRREFPMEGGHRWFDLRRYGMPEISHSYEEVAGTGQVYTLLQGDSRYTLQIPNAVLERNGNLIQNP